jgi:hypothetical protein
MAMHSNPASAALMAYYAMDGNANDSVGGHNGTVTGATLTTDRFGAANSAYSLDNAGFSTASTDYITVGDYGLTGGNATYSIWATAPSGLFERMLFSTLNGPPGPNLYFNNGKVAWDTYDDIRNPFGTFATDSGWHNYTVVLDSVANTAALYFDGILVGDAVYRAPGDSLQIGNTGGADNHSYGWAGSVDDFAIYDTALSGADVANLVSNGISAPVIPEPANLAVLGVGLLGLAVQRRWQKR